MNELATLRRATGATLCVECGKCTALCPLAPYGDFSAARTMSLHDPESELGHYARAVERCLTCGGCELRCPQGVRYTEFVRGLRADLPAGHRRPRPHGEVFQAAARVDRSPVAADSPPKWLDAGLSVSTEGEVALFVGCLPLFDAFFSDAFGVRTLAIANAAVRLLNAVGIEPVVVAGERCCGHDLLWGGEAAAFEELARDNCQRFKERGIRRIVTACAECCRTWRLDYPRVMPDYQPRVEHLAELLSSSVETDGLTFRPADNGAITYQDPCRLGRHLGHYDEPRRLLSAIPGAHLVEMERSGQDALCCGTSGFIHCDSVSRQLQSSRLRQAAGTGAGKLLTACPKCLLHFRCAQIENRRNLALEPQVEVEDLAVYLASNLDDSEQSSEAGSTMDQNSGERS